jgi:hypothetical protein
MLGTPKPQGQPVGTEPDARQTSGNETGIKEKWVKPEITSSLAISEAQGISFHQLDGTSNNTYF